MGPLKLQDEIHIDIFHILMAGDNLDWVMNFTNWHGKFQLLVTGKQTRALGGEPSADFVQNFTKYISHSAPEARLLT